MNPFCWQIVIQGSICGRNSGDGTDSHVDVAVGVGATDVAVGVGVGVGATVARVGVGVGSGEYPTQNSLL